MRFLLVSVIKRGIYFNSKLFHSSVKWIYHHVSTALTHCRPPVVPQVFFTRNGKLMGRREMAVPPGGLYPTVGMLSSGEKVKVDLHPLSG